MCYAYVFNHKDLKFNQTEIIKDYRLSEMMELFPEIKKAPKMGAFFSRILIYGRE